MSSSDSSPAKRQGELLVALGNHMAQHPHLATVNVRHDGDLHLSGVLNGPPEVLAWAKSVGATEVTIGQHGSTESHQAVVRANGKVAGHHVSVWDVENAYGTHGGRTDGTLWRWLPGASTSWRNTTSITLRQLADYVAAGSVDAAVSA